MSSSTSNQCRHSLNRFKPTLNQLCNINLFNSQFSNNIKLCLSSKFSNSLSMCICSLLRRPSTFKQLLNSPRLFKHWQHLNTCKLSLISNKLFKPSKLLIFKHYKMKISKNFKPSRILIFKLNKMKISKNFKLSRIPIFKLNKMKISKNFKVSRILIFKLNKMKISKKFKLNMKVINKMCNKLLKSKMFRKEVRKRNLNSNQGKKILNMKRLKRKMIRNITKRKREMFKEESCKIINLNTKIYNRTNISQKNTSLRQSTNMKTSLRTNSMISTSKRKCKELWAQEWEYIRNTSQLSQSNKFITNLNMSMSNLRMMLSIKEKLSRSVMKQLIKSSFIRLNIKIF